MQYTLGLMITLTLGFVGGCLTHQAGIPHPRLFHRLLARRLEDERGVRLRLVVEKEFADEPRLRVARLLRDEQPDVILLHRSTNTFFTKAMAVFVTAGGRYVVNPFLFQRHQRRSWLDYERGGFRDCLPFWRSRRTATPNADDTTTSHAVDPRARSVLHEELVRLDASATARGFRWRDLAWTVADWTGLVAWAIDDELRIVREAHARCMAAGRPLIVLGPGLRIGTPRANRHAARLDAAFENWVHKAPPASNDQATAASPASYVSLMTGQRGSRSPGPLGVEHYRDVIHFNPAGHEHVAARLEPALLQSLFLPHDNPRSEGRG